MGRDLSATIYLLEPFQVYEVRRLTECSRRKHLVGSLKREALALGQTGLDYEVWLMLKNASVEV